MEDYEIFGDPVEEYEILEEEIIEEVEHTHGR